MSTKPISDNELAALIQTELQQSNSWAGSEWREAIKQSVNYLLLKKKGDENEGRSQVQSGDVADMLDHVQAEIQPMYAGDSLAEVKPEGPQDQSADVESQALNWYWTERLRGFDKLDDAVQDGLLSRNGYMKVWFEESYGLPHEQTIQGDRLQIDAELAQLDQENRIEVLSEAETQAARIATTEAIGPDGVTPILAEVMVAPAQYAVELKLTPLLREVKGESVAPEDMFVSQDAIGSNMQQPRFVGQRRRMARMDVKALGFDPTQVDRMPQTATYDSDVKTARKSDYNTYQRQGAHPSGQIVDLYEVYYRIDRDGDGIPELWKCFYSSNKELLRYDGEKGAAAEMVRLRPFAAGSPMKVAHRHAGRSIYDKEKEVEDTKRSLIRQMLDNLELGNDNGFIVGPTVVREDLEETAAVRYISAANVDDIRPIPYTPTAQWSLQGLGYMDKIRRERGGGSIDTSNENAPVNQAAHSTERIMSAMERLVAMYARNFANTLIRDTFVLLHQQLKLMPGRIAFESGQDWEETEPRLWMDRTRIGVRLVDSMGEKMRKQQALTAVIDIQRQDAQSPYGILSDPKAAYEARVDYARASGLDDPSQYFVDPESPKGQQAMQAQQMAAQAQQQREEAQNQMLLAAQMQVTRMQEETKRAAEAIRAIQADKDRLAEMLQKAGDLAQKYVEMEFKYGADVPGEGIEDGQVVQLTQS